MQVRNLPKKRVKERLLGEPMNKKPVRICGEPTGETEESDALKTDGI